MKNPKTKEEWQEAVDAANGALALESARMYGLVVGGPEINQARCIEILKRGKKIGILPAKDSIERFVEQWQRGQG